MTAERPPLMARVGRVYFAKRSASRPPPPAADALHVLNADERRALRRVTTWALIRSASAGAVSGGVAAAAEVWANQQLSEDPVAYWSLVGTATVLTAALEIAFIYWDTLRSVHELTRVAGLELFGAERSSSDEALVDALARAALELPNPPHLDDGAVDPHREAKKWQLVAASFAYKAKVGVTNFLLKVVVRRVAGRAAVRSLVPFVALPVTAAWNAVVTWNVLREARVRAMGPSAIDELVHGVLKEVTELSDDGKRAAARAVGSAIVRTKDLHPNLVRLFRTVMHRLQVPADQTLDAVEVFLAQLPGLAPQERAVALELLTAACILDGRLTRGERSLWVDAMNAAGRPADLQKLEDLRLTFVEGRGFAQEVLKAF